MEIVTVSKSYYELSDFLKAKIKYFTAFPVFFFFFFFTFQILLLTTNMSSTPRVHHPFRRSQSTFFLLAV